MKTPSKPSKHEVIQWLQTPEFDTGLALLRRFNPLVNPRNTRAIAAKLCYITGIQYQEPKKEPLAKSKELLAISNLPLAEASQEPKANSQQPTAGADLQSVPTTPQHYLELIVREHASLVQLRSQLDIKRKQLGTANDEQTKKDRKLLSESIKQLSIRIEAMYNAKEDYYTKGIIPNLEALGLKDPFAEPQEAAPASKDQRPKTKDLPADEPQTPNTEPQTPPSPRLTQLREMQARDQSLLDFQETKPQPEPNPMPEGPKRRSIIARMDKRLIEIEKITKT